MIEIAINRLPGGDATRRQVIARVTLTNTGEGIGGVKVYDIQLAEAEESITREAVCTQARTHREATEGALHLIYRALGRLLGEPKGP